MNLFLFFSFPKKVKLWKILLSNMNLKTRRQICPLSSSRVTDFLTFQWRKLSEHDSTTSSSRMGIPTSAPERTRTRGHVEPALDRQGDVQKNRPQRHSTFGNHHRGVHGVRTNPRLVVQHESRAFKRRWTWQRQTRQHEQQCPRVPARLLFTLRRDRCPLETCCTQPWSIAFGTWNA